MIPAELIYHISIYRLQESCIDKCDICSIGQQSVIHLLGLLDHVSNSHYGKLLSPVDHLAPAILNIRIVFLKSVISLSSGILERNRTVVSNSPLHRSGELISVLRRNDGHVRNM